MIKIVADTLSNIPPAEAKELGVAYLPQVIIFGTESYYDDYEINSEIFLKKLRSSTQLPKTAAPPPELYHPIFEEFSNAGHTIIVIAPSTELSGTYRSAMVAARDFPNADIRIIDTRVIGGGLAAIVRQAVSWAEQGLDAETLVKNIEEMSARHRIYFVVDTLEYLHKGGRIGGAKALMGSILQIKPILSLQNGRIEPIESQRTHRKAIERLREIIDAECPHGEDSFLCMMHGDALEETSQLAKGFEADLGLSNIHIYWLPPAILVHVGPGLIAASFFVAK